MTLHICFIETIFSFQWSTKRTTGIEPAFPAWKAGALAIVLHPHDLIVLASLPIAAGGIEPSTSRVWTGRSSQLSYTAITIFIVNRENRIRTCDPLVPNQVLYQTELFPDNRSIKLWPIKNAPSRSRTYNLLIRSQTLYPVALWVHINF